MNGVLALPSSSEALKNMCEFAFESDLIPPWWPEQKQAAYVDIFGTSTPWSLPIFSFGPPMLFHYLFNSPENQMAVRRTELYSIPLRYRLTLE